MNKHTNTIVINGRRYNARTGEAVPHEAKPAAGTRPSVAATSHGAGGRPPARHVAAHPPKPTRTLMRQAVKKPPDSPKRRIKVQGHLGGAGGPSHSKIISRTPAKTSHRQTVRHHAVKGNRGQLISHFSPHLFTNVDHITVRTSQSVPAAALEPQAAARPAPVHKKTRTTAELLDYAVQQASAPQPPPPRKRHRKPFSR